MTKSLDNNVDVALVSGDDDRATQVEDLGLVEGAHKREMTFVTTKDSVVAMTIAATTPPTRAMAPSPVASSTLRAMVSVISGTGAFTGFDSSSNRPSDVESRE